MRRWMQTKLVRALVVGASVLVLASCLVDSGNSKTYTSSSTQLPVYSNGHVITMQYESYLVGGLPQSPDRNLTMRWNQTTLTLPFTGTFRGPVLRYVFEEAGGRNAIQYVTQDQSGSIFLHAFEGPGPTATDFPKNSLWPDPDRDGVLESNDNPEVIQVFWSPLTAGIDRALNRALDYFIMGECTSSACTSIAEMEATPYTPPTPPRDAQDIPIPGFEVTSGGKQSVTTPLGTFEAYHLRYRGTLTVTREHPIGPSFDYRTSCLTSGAVGSSVFYDGEIWIYPPIGPVKIRNFCFPSIGGASTSYIAQIISTNIPFE